MLDKCRVHALFAVCIAIYVHYKLALYPPGVWDYRVVDDRPGTRYANRGVREGRRPEVNPNIDCNLLPQVSERTHRARTRLVLFLPPSLPPGLLAD